MIEHTEISAPESAIGVISDTHGMLRTEVLEIFQGVDMIVHAGDVGNMEILKVLEGVAPVTAVSGNMDYGAVTVFLNEVETFEFDGFNFHVRHDLSHMNINPAVSGIDMVISGHTHIPVLASENGVIYLNPGSAGPERKNKPISLAKVLIQNGRFSARHFYL